MDTENKTSLAEDLAVLVGRTQAVPQAQQSLDDIFYGTTLPWAVRGWLAYWRSPPYERVCLNALGLKAPTLYASYEGSRVLMIGVAQGLIMINQHCDPEGSRRFVAITELTDFGAQK